MSGTGWRTPIAGLFAIVLVLAACGGEDDDPTPAPTGETGGGATGETGGTPTGETGGGTTGGPTLTIEGFAFEPTTLQVEPGDVTLTITNNDGTAHTFTTDAPLVDETIGGGETVEVEFTGEGSISLGFHCSFHPQMTGTLEFG
jgi:plastocyanin